MTETIEAVEAWWPPTFRPDTLGRTRFAWSIIAMASHSTRDSTARSTSRSTSSGAGVDVIAGTVGVMTRDVITYSICLTRRSSEGATHGPLRGRGDPRRRRGTAGAAAPAPPRPHDRVGGQRPGLVGRSVGGRRQRRVDGLRGARSGDARPHPGRGPVCPGRDGDRPANPPVAADAGLAVITYKR